MKSRRYCEFAEDRVCIHCQRPLPDRYSTKVKRRCHRECPHLLAPTGEIELIQCKTCSGRVRNKYPVSGCALFAKCLPTYRAAEPTEVRVCRSCPENPANA